MSDLTLGAPVTGNDEPIGRLTALVCDPTTNELTHLVVNVDDVPGSERLVPIERLAEADDDHLTLALSRHQFFRLKTLETVWLLPGNGAPDADWHLPFQLGDHTMTFALHERIPRSEVALRRETKVVDRGGRHLGRVNAFVVDPDSHDVTHLMLQRGHLFGRQDVTIPVTDMTR
jgi:sporulation protein YlmC with PRC-barrel domain